MNMNKDEYKHLQKFFNEILKIQLKIEYAHGAITAFICSPQLIEPSEWMPSLLSDNGEMPEFTSKEQANEFSGLLIKLYEEISESLFEKRFKPLISLENEKVKPDDACLWCKGFIDGMSLWDKNKYDPGDDELMGFLISLMVLADAKHFFSNITDEEYIEDDSMKKTKEDALKNLPNIIIYIKQYFQMRLNRKNNKLKKAKTGRNETCPCGSGKKYKLCCGK